MAPIRLFVAADISAETHAQIRTVRDQLEPRLRGPRAPRVTWVKDEAAHVSLRFIGEVSEDQATALAAELEKGIALRPFDVEWGRVGTFPGGRAPRVVWIGATAGAAALVTLASMVAVRLDPIIGSSDSRPFKPHVTICRVRVPGRVDWPNILSSVKFEPTITRVDHVTLYRSRLSPQGPTYTQLTRIALV